MNTEKLHRITLRVEKKLKNDFKRVALKNSRSVNAEIMVAMQNHVYQHELSQLKKI